MNANNQKILSKVVKNIEQKTHVQNVLMNILEQCDDKCKLDITCNEEDGDEEIEYCGIYEEIFH